MSLTMEEVVELGMEKFVDDRHLCSECVNYKPDAWKGLCVAQKIQYGKVMNRCNTFVGKLVKKESFTEEAFWE